MNEKEITKILKAHAKWLENDAGGVCANFRGANLCYANLSGADLSGADLAHTQGVPPLSCPEEGTYIGFKKAGGYIIVLEIAEDAKRSSATSRKCRASKAKVLRIENIDGTTAIINGVASDFDESFIYTVGETISVNDFDEDRWCECAPGIHHFITRQEAVSYTL